MGRSPVSHSLPNTDSEGHWRVQGRNAVANGKLLPVWMPFIVKQGKCAANWHSGSSSSNFKNQKKEEKVHFLN